MLPTGDAMCASDHALRFRPSLLHHPALVSSSSLSLIQTTIHASRGTVDTFTQRPTSK